MARDPLHVLATLRRLSVDAARREVVQCEQFQVALDSHITACDKAIADNEPMAGDTGCRTAFINDFYQYEERLQRRTDFLKRHVPIAQTKTDTARHALAQARLAHKAVEQVALKRDQDKQAEVERRAQHVLDDVARFIRQSAARGTR